MTEVEFILNGQSTIIQCNTSEKMLDIIKKYGTKALINLNELNFLYKGDQLKIDSTFEEVASNMDKERKKMSVLVITGEEDEQNINAKKSRYIICPECKENARISMKDYKISLYDCKNEHRKDNISLDKFDSTQYLDENKILCDNCKNNNKGSTYENKFFICYTCKINLCPLCKGKHDNEHELIDYDQKFFICDSHNENFISYCENCKIDICIMCEKEHVGHNLIGYGEIVQDKKELKKNLNDLKNKINQFKNDIKDIITKLNDLMENLDLYYNIYEDMIKYYDKKNRNYSILKNIIDMNKINITFIEDINKIIDDKNFKNKFNNMIDIYDKMTIIDNKNDTPSKEEKSPQPIEQKNQIKEANKKIETENINLDIPKKDNLTNNLNNLLNKNFDSFQIHNLKKIKSFSIEINESDIKNITIYDFIVLKDNRILLDYYYDKGNKRYEKLIIYNPENNDIFEINFKSSLQYYYSGMCQMEENIIIILQSTDIYIIDILENNIIRKQNIEIGKDYSTIKLIKLSDKKIAIFYEKNESIMYDIYSYENRKLIFINSKKLKEKAIEYKICVISEDKFAMSFWYEGLLGLFYHYLILYDIKKGKKIKTFKCSGVVLSMGLLNKNNFIFLDDKKIKLVNLENYKIINEIHFDSRVRLDFIFLDKNKFLLHGEDGAYLFFFDGDNINTKGVNGYIKGKIKKYSNGSIVIINKNSIKIFN